jgi:hypothetical protein
MPSTSCLSKLYGGTKTWGRRAALNNFTKVIAKKKIDMTWMSKVDVTNLMVAFGTDIWSTPFSCLLNIVILGSCIASRCNVSGVMCG